MRFIWSTILGAALFAGAVGPAQAARVSALTGYTEQMHFVADTGVRIGGQPFALCHMTKKFTAMFVIGFWRSSGDYVLARNACQAEEYYPLSAAKMAGYKANGLIAANVPDTPKMTGEQILSGFWGLAAVGAFLGYGAVSAARTRKRRSGRQAVLGHIAPEAKAVLEAMCRAAKIDGEIADEEVFEIVAAGEAMTGQEIDPADVLRMAEMAEDNLRESDFKQMVKGQAPNTLEVMMRGVLHVVAADGTMEPQEKSFIGGLAKAMKMPGQKVQAILEEVVAANSREAMA